MLKNRAIASATAAVDKFNIIASILDLEPKQGWTLWEDTEGNRLRIAKNRAVQVYETKDRSSTTNDVFRKSHPAMIAKKSYWVLGIFGKTDTVLCFMGKDGTLRVSYFREQKWVENISPVLLGIQTLKQIASGFIDEDPRKVYGLKVRYPREFEIETAWATGFPSPSEELQDKIICHLKT